MLREERIGGRQLFGEFMTRRFDPAMRTCRSAKERLAELSDRAERAANLLRTRVDVANQAQNVEVLRAMDRRAAMQLRLQETVEGLSVVAISYYAVNLAEHVFGPVAERAHVSRGDAARAADRARRARRLAPWSAASARRVARPPGRRVGGRTAIRPPFHSGNSSCISGRLPAPALAGSISAWHPEPGGHSMEQFLSIILFNSRLRSARRPLPLDEAERSPKPRDPEARERLISRIAARPLLPALSGRGRPP